MSNTLGPRAEFTAAIGLKLPVIGLGTALGGLLAHKPPSATVNNSISKCHSIDTQHRPRYSSSEHRLLSLGGVSLGVSWMAFQSLKKE
ncbi:hypothetical protein J6590_080384 [Homalodisca vitripennis]|nr:hypothetical protein J6590_080384 [Homalodisca vitripennis]